MPCKTIHVFVQVKNSFFPHIMINGFVVRHNHIDDGRPFFFGKQRNEKQGSNFVTECKIGLLYVIVLQCLLKQWAGFANVVQYCTFESQIWVKSDMLGNDNSGIGNIFKVLCQRHPAKILVLCQYVIELARHSYKSLLPLYSIQPYIGLLLSKRL